jgi:hypothetical protein
MDDELAEIKQRLAFTHEVACMAMFTLSRLMPVMVKRGIIDPDIVERIHGLYLKLEAEPDFLPQDVGRMANWREILGREAD